MTSRRRPPGSGPPDADRPRTRRPSVIAAVSRVPSIEEIEERLALDDHTAALEMARARLRARPNDAKAADYVERCEQTLTEMYQGRIGDLRQPVQVAMNESELHWLNLDHRAGFMVSRVDGPITVEELLEICGMPRLDALRTLHDLVQQKVITLGDDD